LGEHEVHVLNTGIGIGNTALHLGYYLQLHQPGLVIHTGIAGTYDDTIPLCTVGIIESETFADLGAEMADGTVQDFFQLGLMDPNDPPWRTGRIWNEQISAFDFLPRWHGLTVNCVTGTEASLQSLRSRFPYGQIENMEGAAFFQTCAFYHVPYLAVRAISNRVEVRNRASWRVQEAVEQLNAVVWEMLQSLKL
jgi:futalosine hydrolase